MSDDWVETPPTYDEAVSEEHRTGHEPMWEMNANGQVVCSLCGWTYGLVIG